MNDRNEWSEEVLGNIIKGKHKEAGRKVRRDSKAGEGWRGKKATKEGQSLLLSRLELSLSEAVSANDSGRRQRVLFG